MWKAWGNVNSNNVTVIVNNPCDPAQIVPGSVSADSTVASGTAVPLTVAGTGSAPLTYQWYRRAPTGDVAVGASASVTLTVTQTSTFYAKVFSTCRGNTTSDTSHDVTVTVRLPAPAGLTATLTGSTVITVSWQPVAGAFSYKLERRSNGTPFQFLASIAGATQYSDAGRTLNTTYQYRAFALDGNGQSGSAYSGADLATTKTFTSIAPGMIVRAAHVNEVLDELNALRMAAGSAPVSWQQILPATTPVPTVRGLIYAGHIEALRREINTALQALGMPTPAYSDVPPLRGRVIRAIHLTELQRRAQ